MEHELSFTELMVAADAAQQSQDVGVLTFEEDWSSQWAAVREEHKAKVLRAVADLS